MPLVITAAPFVARVVEQSLAEVDGSLIEAAQSFGASKLQIVCKVLLWEALPSLIRGAALTFITLLDSPQWLEQLAQADSEILQYDTDTSVINTM